MVSTQNVFSGDRPRSGKLEGHLIIEDGAKQRSAAEIDQKVEEYLRDIDLSCSDDLSELPTIWVQFRESHIFVKALWPGDVWPEHERQSLLRSSIICNLTLAWRLDEGGKTDERKVWGISANFFYERRPTLSSLDMVPPPADNSHAEDASTSQTTSSSKEARIVELERQMRDSEKQLMTLEFDNGTLRTRNSALETHNDQLQAEKAMLQARAEGFQLALRRLGLSMASASIEALEASKASEGPSQESRSSGLSCDEILRILQSLA